MQKWILYTCAVLIVVSIFHVLTPNNSTKGVMKFFLNLFLIGLILTPIFKNTKSSPFKNYLTHNFTNFNENEVQKNITELNKKNLERALTILLQNSGYKNFKINLEIGPSKQDTKINIYFTTNQKINVESIKNIVKQQTGITPKIYNSNSTI